MEYQTEKGKREQKGIERFKTRFGDPRLGRKVTRQGEERKRQEWREGVQDRVQRLLHLGRKVTRQGEERKRKEGIEGFRTEFKGYCVWGAKAPDRARNGSGRTGVMGPGQR
jgi:hypothetical protein